MVSTSNPAILVAQPDLTVRAFTNMMDAADRDGLRVLDE